MHMVAVILLADTGSLEGLGRAANALEAVKEFRDAGDRVRLIFDGAGTKWVGELENPDHRIHALYRAVKSEITGACGFCAGAFGVGAELERGQVPLMAEYDGHPSYRKLVAAGYQVITF